MLAIFMNAPMKFFQIVTMDTDSVVIPAVEILPPKALTKIGIVEPPMRVATGVLVLTKRAVGIERNGT